LLCCIAAAILVTSGYTAVGLVAVILVPIALATWDWFGFGRPEVKRLTSQVEELQKDVVSLKDRNAGLRAELVELEGGIPMRKCTLCTRESRGCQFVEGMLREPHGKPTDGWVCPTCMSEAIHAMDGKQSASMTPAATGAEKPRRAVQQAGS